MADAYAIILDQEKIPSVIDLAKALAHAHGTPVIDQTQAAKRAWGILAEAQTEEAAASLHAKLLEAKLPNRLIKEAEMPVMPEAKPLTHWETFAPERVAVLGVASVPQSTTTTKTIKEGPSAAQKIINTTVLMSTGLPLKLGGKTRIVEKSTTNTERIFYLDLVLRAPAEHWRIESGHFDYSCLKERKTYQSFANFRLVIDDLLALAPHAAHNHGIHVLQEKKPLLEMDYASLADFERELRWRYVSRK